MRIIRKPYDYFGHQCTQCGCYFIYNQQDLAIGDLTCPCCNTPFSHDINTADVEPNIEKLQALYKESLASTEKIFEVGDEVYVAYDDYYSNFAKRDGGFLSHNWVVPNRTFKISKIEITEDKDGKEETLYFEDIVFLANDPRQHCKETFNGCIAFRTKEEADVFAESKNVKRG